MIRHSLKKYVTSMATAVGAFGVFFSHLGMILFCGLLEWRAVLTQKPVPSWMFQDRAAIEANLLRAG